MQYLAALIDHLDMDALMTTLGFTLSVAGMDKSLPCTVNTSLSASEDSAFDIVNAMVERPDLRGKDAGRYYRNVRIKFTDVEEV